MNGEAGERLTFSLPGYAATFNLRAAPYLFILVPSLSRRSPLALFLWQKEDIPSTSRVPPVFSPHTKCNSEQNGRRSTGGAWGALDGGGGW